MLNTVSISDLKVNPAAVLAGAADYPVAISKKGRVGGYLVGRELFEKLVAFVEDQVDVEMVEKTDFSKGDDFEKVAKELGI